MSRRLFFRGHWSSRRTWILSLVLLVGFVAAAPVHAALPFQTQLYNFLGGIVLLLLQTVAQIAALFIHILVIVAQYNNFLHVGVVINGWQIVSDIANMFFIVALLVIAAGTVLRLENYRYNKLLGNLILMAFMVNFSKLIAGFFIQTSQIVMLTFVNAFKDALFGNFASMFGLDKVLQFAATADPANGFADIMMSLIAGLALMVVAMIVMLALTAVLVVRIVTLWILVILSPLAYALQILPNTKGYAADWWKEFTKALTTGPVIAFFIWLALAVVVSGNGSGDGSAGGFITYDSSVNQAVQDISKTREELFGFNTQLLQIDTFISFFVAVMFMLMALKYATDAGGVAGAWSKNISKKGFSAVLGGASAASGLNALRDRTIAPIQGYLKARQGRREGTIRERSVALGRNVDQVGQKLVAPITSSFKAADTMRQSLGQAGVATAKGIKAGGIGLGAQQGLGVLGAAADRGFQQGTRGSQQARARIDQAKEAEVDRVAKEQNLTNPTTTVAHLTNMAQTTDGAERYAAVRELIRRNALKEGNTDHEKLAQSAAAYAGTRDLGKKFNDDLQKTSPTLAKKVLFGDISQNSEARQKFKEALQAGTATTALISESDARYMGSTVRAEMGTFLKDISRNKGELKKHFDGLNENIRDDIFKKANMDGETDDRRKIFAEVTGEAGQAFRQGGEITGDSKDPESLKYKLVEFFKSRGKKLSDIISTSGAADDEMLKVLEGEISEAELLAIGNKSDYHRDALNTGLSGGVIRDPDGTETTVIGARARQRAETGGKEVYHRGQAGFGDQEKFRRVTFRNKAGEVNPYQLDGTNNRAKELFGEMAKSLTADQAKRIHKNKAYDNPVYKKIVDEQLGLNMGTKALGELATKSPESYSVAKAAVKSAFDAGKELVDISNREVLKNLTLEERQIRNRARRLSLDEATIDLLRSAEPA